MNGLLKKSRTGSQKLDGGLQLVVGVLWNSLNDLGEAYDPAKIREMSVPDPTATSENVIAGAFPAIIPPDAPGVVAYIGGCEGVFQEAHLIFFVCFLSF